MATWDDVDRVALALPETGVYVSRGSTQWRVKDKLFVWERPLSQKDLKALGDRAPNGPALGARVAHEGVKFALIEENPTVYFTIPHFNGYPAILAYLDRMDLDSLEALTLDAWHAVAPPKVAGLLPDRVQRDRTTG